MRCLGHVVLFFVVCLALSTVQAGGKKDSLSGVWIPQKITVGGKDVPKDELKKIKLTVKKNTYTIVVAGKLLSKGGFSTNTSKKPKQIDITAESPDGKKKQKVLGIYKLEGDLLTVCGSAPGLGRPTDFTSKAGSNRELVVYRRQKK